MSSEQTWLSKKLSPIIEGTEVPDLLFVLGVVLTLVAVFTPLIHPAVGIGSVWLIYLALEAMDFYGEERSPLKNGMYTEIERSDEFINCRSCGNGYKHKTGYRMLYILGYEVFRLEQFKSDECEDCADKDVEMLKDV